MRRWAATWVLFVVLLTGQLGEEAHTLPARVVDELRVGAGRHVLLARRVVMKKARDFDAARRCRSRSDGG